MSRTTISRAHALKRAQRIRRSSDRREVATGDLRARYELAERTIEKNELFARAHHESGRTSLMPGDRRTMIDRSRQEIQQNNPWLKGSKRASVVSVIGRGPAIEVTLPGTATEIGNLIEREFNQWLKSVRAAKKLRTMLSSKRLDGAAYAMIINDDSLPADRPQLNFAPFDDDHIRSPLKFTVDAKEVSLDGKEIGPDGQAIAFWVTPQHPAEAKYITSDNEPRRVPAEFVIEVFDADRSSQSRGEPEYATAIGNGPMMRSFRKATLDAATYAAKHSALLQSPITRFDNGEEDYDEIEAYATSPVSYGTIMALPKGWSANQLRAEHPGSTHESFVRSLVAEAGRSINQPSFQALGDALGQNFASAMVLRQDWDGEVDVQRQDWETECLEKLLAHWLRQATLLGMIPGEFSQIESISFTWRWGRKRHQDTNREYSGRAIAVQHGLGSRERFIGDDGLDPQEEDEVSARGYGVDVETYRRALFLHVFGDSAKQAMGLIQQQERDTRQQDNGDSGDHGDDDIVDE